MSELRNPIKQTNRAILFEQFNDQKPSLAQYIRMNAAEGGIVADELHRKIMELEVRSFKEFLEKFSPTIYEYARRVNGRIEIEYTLAKENEDDRVNEIRLADSAYFNTLCNVYAKKGESGKTNYDFDYDTILEELLPEAEAKKIRNLRRDLEMFGTLYYEKKERNEDASRENERMKAFFNKIKDTYSHSDLPLLPAKMEDNDRIIKGIDEYIENNSKNGAAVEGQALPALGAFAFDHEGRATILPLPSPDAQGGQQKDARLALKEKLGAQLVKRIGRDYDIVKAETAEPRTRDLVVSVYTGRSSLANYAPANLEEARETRAALMQAQKEYNRIYTSAKNSLIQLLQTLAAKILNVKVFFDHATAEGSVDGELPKGAGLIIANCDPEDLIANDELTTSFKTALNTFNANPKEKIWFGILPDVKEPKPGRKTEAGNKTDDTAWDEEEEIDVTPGSAKPGAPRKLDYGSACKFMEIMDEAKILTVFNFNPDKNVNTSSALSIKYIRETKYRLEEMRRNAHAVLAYPNFHLMPGKVKPVVKDITLDAGDDPNAYTIFIDDVYISSAYVAAGMLVASQQKDPFKKIGLDNRLLKGNPNVHVNLENPDISLRLVPRFSQELVLNWTPTLKEEIDNSPFGFVFCGDPKFDREANDYLKTVYAYFCRTIFQKNGTYQPVYTTLVKDFIYLYLNAIGTKTKSELKTFLKEDVAQWKEQTKRDPDKLNLILGPEDSITQAEDDPRQLRIKFGPVEETLTVNIVDDPS